MTSEQLTLITDKIHLVSSKLRVIFHTHNVFNSDFFEYLKGENDNIIVDLYNKTIIIEDYDNEYTTTDAYNYVSGKLSDYFSSYELSEDVKKEIGKIFKECFIEKFEDNCIYEFFIMMTTSSCNVYLFNVTRIDENKFYIFF